MFSPKISLPLAVSRALRLALIGSSLHAATAFGLDIAAFAAGPVASIPTPGGGGAGDGGADRGGIPKFPVGLKKLPEGSPWKEITADASSRALCGRGTPFGFFIQEGDPDKLFIDFTGGGACVDAASCSVANPTFFPDLDLIRLLVTVDDGLGIFAPSRTDNPIKGWTHLVIPNCTGDLNVGDHDQTYTNADGSTYVVNHRGAPNTVAALEWAKAEYAKTHSTPKRVVVAGSSAGSYASIFWTPKIARTFPQAAIRQLGDSGAGIQAKPGPFFAPVWNVTASLPTWVPGLNPQAGDDLSNLGMNDLYLAITKAYPRIQFAQFSYNQDETQAFFSDASDFKALQFEPRLYFSLLGIQWQRPRNYHNYLAAGLVHAILVLPDLYTLKTNGVPFTEWFTNYIEGRDVSNVVALPSFDPGSPRPQPQPKLPAEPQAAGTAEAIVAN